MIGYLQAFWEQFNWSQFFDLILRVVGVLLCLTVHETCHGLAAYLMGDPTAKRMKRLSFNPLRHIDWLGLAAMIICGFGWAKPVPVDMRYFKRPRLGMAITALAGPVSNFLLSLLLIFVTSVLLHLGAAGAIAYTVFVDGVIDFLVSTAVLSIGLGLFNLIPIPPLDGSKVLFSVLPEKAYRVLLRYERFGMILLMVIIWLNIGDEFLSKAILSVFYAMFGLFS